MANFFKAKPAKKEKNKQLSLVIEKLDPNGTGVSYHQKKPIFVAGALPGENVSALIVEDKSKYSLAKLIMVETCSTDRVKAECKHFLQCGGCDLQHYQHKKQLEFKQQKVSNYLNRIKTIDPLFNQKLPWQPSITAELLHYRRKARIGVQYTKAGQAIIGFRRKSTNDLIPIKHCAVLVNPIADIFLPLKGLLDKLTLHKAIGHVEVIYTDVVTLVVRQLTPLNNKDTHLWATVAEQEKWQVYFDDGNKLTALHKQDKQMLPLEYQLQDGTKIRFLPNDFIQVNGPVNQKMIAQAIDWLSLKSKDVVLDLFCGLGNFSLPIAKQVQKVVGVEGVQEMVDRAQENARHNDIDNCDFYQANINSSWAESTWTNYSFDKVILDPARAGAFEAMTQIVSMNVSEILYVSCDASSLAKDSQVLLEQGYKIKKIAIMDMFSQTKHVETMVLFAQV